MEPVVIELHKIYTRVKALETRIARDKLLCDVVRQCGHRIHTTLKKQGSAQWS